MEIQSLIQGGSPEADKTGLKKGTVTQEEFLKLLIVQLQNQDPLNPMESQDFLAQLATLNSLDQLIGINGKLSSMQSAQALVSRLEATSLIDKEITAEGNQVNLDETGQADIHYSLLADATRIAVNITDGNGSLVRVLEAGGQGVGDQTVVWDGKDTGGNSVAPGVYTFEVNAFNIEGNQVLVATWVKGSVTGVSLTGSVPVLDVGGILIPINAVNTVESSEQRVVTSEGLSALDSEL